MRGHVAEALASGRRPAVVVGAFHAALLPSTAGAAGGPAPDAADESAATPEPDADARASGGAGARACTVSLVPYTYPLLDSRSGYPAGIRDPEWRQRTVLDAAGDPDALHEAVIRTAVRVCAALREQGHPYGPADGREVVRVAGDLARLRDLPAPVAANSWKPYRRCWGAARPTVRAAPSPGHSNRYSSEPAPDGPRPPLRAADWARPSRPRPRRSPSPARTTPTRRHRATSGSTLPAPPSTSAANCCCAG
ncbi:VWA domain-containing protein OS=Streptomyces microflavus OX=1919 GN=HUT09_00395 PE=4 SV=1 [Streptomyces microflavus]